MTPEDVRVPDFARLLYGQVSALFSLEVLMRIGVLYIVLVAAMSVLGRRLSSGLTRNELLSVVALAAGIGPAVQSPQQGLIPSIVVSVLVVAVQWSLAKLSFRSKRFEWLLQGEAKCLVRDGVLVGNNLRSSAVSRALLFAKLRAAEMQQLGALERVYMEADGSFTLFRAKKPYPGLSLIPPWDAEMRETQVKSDRIACRECGVVVSPFWRGRCENCGGCNWEAAVLPDG